MPVLLQAASASGDLPGGYGLALLQSLLALAAVCLLAWVLLRWLGRRGFGSGMRPGGRIEVLERAPLDAHRVLYIVRVGPRIWLVGTGDGSAPTLLAELDPADLPAGEAPPAKSFSAALGRLSKKRGSLS